MPRLRSARTTPRTRRPAVTGLSALLALGAGLGLTGCAGPAAGGGDPTGTATTAVVGLTFIPNIQFAPFYVAASDGLLPAGVELRHHGAS
ncbi:MAG: hypothetical protein LBL55_06300, partial [Propionibacteriaceae bacterium]|nr:hypothetical protein [Propionibacteriaceae bacterium]